MNNVTKAKATKDYLNFDYSLKHYSERIDAIVELLDSDVDEYGRNHFEVFIDNYYRANINTSKSLSDKIFACRVLENMANYLLGSIEVREERKKNEVKYYFYINQEEFRNRVRKEMFIGDITSSSESEDAGIEANVIHYLNKKHLTNFKKDKKQKITSSDFKNEDELSEILSQYKSILDRTTYLLYHLDETNLKRKQLTTMKKSIVDDMLNVKTAMRGTFGENLKNALVESTEPSWDCFDYTNPNHIKYALRIQRDLEFGDDLAHISLDMDMIVDKLYKAKVITEQQYKVVKLIRTGYTNKDVEEVVKIHNSRVVHIVDAVAKKIAKHYKSLQ